VLLQARFENRAFWRNPAAAFFTFVFPILFLLASALVLDDVAVDSGEAPARFYAPAVMAFALVTAGFTNVAMSVALARESGVLRRIRATPLPTSVYLAGRVLHAVAVAALLVLLVALFAAIVQRVTPDAGGVPLLALAVILGGATFSVLGLAASALVPSAQAAPAVVNALALPLLFVSDVFVPLGDTAPRWLDWVTLLFPVRHLAALFHVAYGAVDRPDPLVSATVLAVWLVLGGAIAVRAFRWAPRD
jgi:ABC-2 type transport system permease protein